MEIATLLNSIHHFLKDAIQLPNAHREGNDNGQHLAFLALFEQCEVSTAKPLNTEHIGRIYVIRFITESTESPFADGIE